MNAIQLDLQRSALPRTGYEFHIHVGLLNNKYFGFNKTGLRHAEQIIQRNCYSSSLVIALFVAAFDFWIQHHQISVYRGARGFK
jgi:hypothetical protein